MNSVQVRKTFLDFFESKNHHIVPSAPMIVKNDPTLMFTNAGMNQFKDIFLGNVPAVAPRVADTQKCLRVSGKHNDLEEVGHDTYHHTMFEMLGNWSFGDYFKKEAIAWSWELLAGIYKINPEKLYVTVFGGDKNDGTSIDEEAYGYWKEIVPESHILFGSKKDNFWEMGETGPCGPCSEIHVDIRDEAEQKIIPGRELVNQSHPLVIEIWNLVFIEFNRLSDGSLVPLPAKHVDTGMGFERLSMVLQGKKSNYDTDIFQPLIQEIARIAGKPYDLDEKTDIAMRVVADHLRAIAFAIADGQLPSNNKAGYVIRRILRRAVRYGYTFLSFNEPFINLLVPLLVEQMEGTFPELKTQQDLVIRVIREEEQAFLRTLSLGIQKFNHYIASNAGAKLIDGEFAFELFDTYGFPIDLTDLMAKENDWNVDMDGFKKGLEQQKARSRQAAAVDTADWVVLKEESETKFVGYDFLEAEAEIVKYRKIKTKGKEFYQIVLNQTPFYAESGGQLGDSGTLRSANETVIVEDTKKENNLVIHITSTLPSDLTSSFIASVDAEKRRLTANNHSATHLLHYALRQIVGTHVEQKGSLVDADHLRFDFSHFAKLTPEEIASVEKLVNQKIRANIPLTEFREFPIKKAVEMGAMALFGEKYGDKVRVVRYGESVELCGGTHVPATGQIGMIKIVSEGAIAAGVRRIEAITADKAEAFINNQLSIIEQLNDLFKNTKDVVRSARQLIEENSDLHKKIEELNHEKIKNLITELASRINPINGINFIAYKSDLDSNSVKDLAYGLKNQVENLFFVSGSSVDDKANLSLMISENLVTGKNLNASVIIRELAKNIQGGGGGQPFYATAGGKNPKGLDMAFEKAKNILEQIKEAE